MFPDWPSVLPEPSTEDIFNAMDAILENSSNNPAGSGSYGQDTRDFLNYEYSGELTLMGPCYGGDHLTFNQDMMNDTWNPPLTAPVDGDWMTGCQASEFIPEPGTVDMGSGIPGYQQDIWESALPACEPQIINPALESELLQGLNRIFGVQKEIQDATDMLMYESRRLRSELAEMEKRQSEELQLIHAEMSKQGERCKNIGEGLKRFSEDLFQTLEVENTRECGTLGVSV